MVNFKLKLLGVVCVLLIIAGFAWWHTTHDTQRVDMIINNARIVTMEREPTIIDQGWMAINHGTIVAIEPGECCGRYRSPTYIDAHGTLALPGLVNTHSHVGMTSLRNVDNSHKLEQWLQNTGAAEKNFTPEEVYHNSKRGLEEMMRTGITTVNDMYFFPEQTIKAAQELGMRVMVRIPTARNESGALQIDHTFYDTYKNTPLVYLNLAPNPLTEYSLEELRWFARTANELHVPIHIHLAEDPSADQEILQKFGISPLELLKQSDLINTKLIIAHAVTFSASEITELAAHPNIAISFNPKSNYLLSDYTAPIDQYLAHDMVAGIGTDGAASGGMLDILDQIHFAAFVSRCSSTLSFCVDQRQIAPYMWMHMATMGGAKTLGLENSLGSLEVGKQADIILIDATSAHADVHKNLYDALVYNTSATHVNDVIVAGKIVLRNKKLAK